jgi:hypothetical protein
MMRLTFDWDSVGLEDKLVQEGLAKLSKDFPKYDVYYRISASGCGIHAIISPKNMTNPSPVEIDDGDALNYRQEMVDFGLEDVWRLKGDKARLKSGGITAQLFQYKNGNTAGVWVKYVE